MKQYNKEENNETKRGDMGREEWIKGVLGSSLNTAVWPCIVVSECTQTGSSKTLVY
jgi:hypothetical protein